MVYFEQSVNDTSRKYRILCIIDDGSGEFYKFLKGNYCDSMFLHDTTCAEVNKEIEEMANKSSCGIDDIKSKVVKHVAPYTYLYHCLTFLILLFQLVKSQMN